VRKVGNLIKEHEFFVFLEEYDSAQLYGINISLVNETEQI